MAIPSYVGKIDMFDHRLKLKEIQPGLASRITRTRRQLAKRYGCSFYDIKDSVEWKNVLTTLIRSFPESTDLWWKPERVDIFEDSELLTSYGMTHFFGYWWDPYEFDWVYRKNLISNMTSWFTHWWDASRFEPIEDYLATLVRNCGKYFDVWWPGGNILDRIKDINDYSLKSLVQDLSYYQICDFDVWWRPDVIFDKEYSYTNQFISTFCRRYPDHFDTWWNPEVFQWNHFDKQKFDDMLYHLPLWWDGDKIPDRFWEEHSISLCEKASWCFDVWWDPEKFNYGKNQSRKDYTHNKTYYLFGREYLMKHCPDHIDKWYSKVKIRANKKNIKLLKKYCQTGYDYWGPDFISMTLADELNNEQEDSD